MEKVNEKIENLIVLDAPESLNIKPAIFRKGKDWYVALRYGDNDYIKIEDSIGKTIYVALKAEEKLHKAALKSQEKGSDTERLLLLYGYLNKINCHKMILYIVGDSIRELSDTQDEYSDKRISQIMSKDWEDMLTLEQFEVSIQKESIEYPSIVTMFGRKNNNTNNIPVHSYLILGLDNSGRIIAFHKAGLGVTVGSRIGIEPADLITNGYIGTAKRDGIYDIRLSVVALSDFEK